MWTTVAAARRDPRFQAVGDEASEFVTGFTQSLSLHHLHPSPRDWRVRGSDVGWGGEDVLTMPARAHGFVDNKTRKSIKMEVNTRVISLRDIVRSINPLEKRLPGM